MLFRHFVESFLPILMAINLPGILPMYVSLTEPLNEKQRNQLTTKAVGAGFCMALLFVFVGQFIFYALHITVNDLRVGGGLVLLVLSITNLLFSDFRTRKPENGDSKAIEDMGIVPIATPLMIGPSAITTIIVSQQSYGYLATVLALSLNMLVVFGVFYFGPSLMRRLGPNVSKAAAKVASLFLAATAIGMIRKGVVGMVMSLIH